MDPTDAPDPITLIKLRLLTVATDAEPPVRQRHFIDTQDADSNPSVDSAVSSIDE